MGHFVYTVNKKLKTKIFSLEFSLQHNYIYLKSFEADLQWFHLSAYCSDEQKLSYTVTSRLDVLAMQQSSFLTTPACDAAECHQMFKGFILLIRESNKALIFSSVLSYSIKPTGFCLFLQVLLLVSWTVIYNNLFIIQWFVIAYKSLANAFSSKMYSLCTN